MNNRILLGDKIKANTFVKSDALRSTYQNILEKHPILKELSLKRQMELPLCQNEMGR